MSGLHVSGVVVRARPEFVDRVQAQLATVSGAEVHTATPEGRLVTIIERDSEAELANVFHDLQHTAGVLSASPVYHYSDELEALDEEVTS